MVISLFTPFYFVDEYDNYGTLDVHLYSELYVYDSDDHFQIWDYSDSDNLPLIITLGVSWGLTAFACLILVYTALRSNRGRVAGMIAFGSTIIAFVAGMFIPFGMNPCNFHGTTDNNSPCTSIWGSSTTTQTSWGMYYGWYILGVGCLGCIVMEVIGLLSPRPDPKNEEFDPLNDYYS